MPIGKRIQERLDQLGWKQKDLADASALHTDKPLSMQTISNLIRRDSKRSEQDEIIAKALGVDVMWLVYGDTQQPQTHTYGTTDNVTMLHAREKQAVYGPIDELLDAAKALSDTGVRELIGQARLLRGIHPKPKANHAR